MGNHALRKKLARELKAAGHSPKLYIGNKHIAYRFFRASTLNEHLRMVAIKPGDIVNDYDGFNHEIKKLLPWLGRWDGKTHVLLMDQFEFTDGKRSCGCSCPGVVPAWSVEKITAYYRPHTDEEIAELKKGAWWGPLSQRCEDYIRSGAPVCDERGFRLLPDEDIEPEQEGVENA